MKPNSLILIDKPKGITSFDVIRILRKKLGIKKMGHAGTLDPMATGLLIVGVGEGTKRLEKLIGLPKVYEAEILLGVRTNTGDVTGEVVEEKEVLPVTGEQIAEMLKGSVGKIKLPVPIFSAVKRQGKPLYKYARKGEVVEVPVKEMEIVEVELIGSAMEENRFQVRVNVKSGTYVRSLAEEWGRRLGTVATLKGLRRISIGQYSIEDAVSPDDI
jgi:tRNA pseudouridine55 synthase